MSINLIATTGLSLLQSAQYQAQVTSSNMANVRTEGYSAKHVAQSAATYDGITTGVNTTKITSRIDSQLQRKLTQVISENGFNETVASHLKDLTGLFGKLNDRESTLSAKISIFEAKLNILKNKPDSSENVLQAVRALENLAHSLRETSKNIQAQRSRISHDIETDISQTNSTLKEVHHLNEEIAHLSAQGKSSADLADQRRVALQKLSQSMDVSYYINAENKAVVSTTSGTILIASHVKTLSYTSPATLTHKALYPASIPAITVDGKDITGEIKGGKTGALIRLRDIDLVKKHDELNEFAMQLKNKLNALSTKGVPFPLSQSIVGDHKLTGATSLAMSGQVKIALTDANGKTQSVHSVDLSTVSSIGGLITKLNTLGGVNAALDGDGKLKISATSATQRIALIPDTDKDGSTPAKNLSQIVGISTLMQASGVHDINVNKALKKNPSLFPKGLADLTVSQTLSASADTRNIDNLLQGLKAQTFKAAGDMVQKTTSFTQYSAQMLSLLAEKSANSSSQAKVSLDVSKGIERDIASKSAVNMNEEIAHLSQHQKNFEIAGHIMQATQKMFDTILRMSR